MGLTKAKLRHGYGTALTDQAKLTYLVTGNMTTNAYACIESEIPRPLIIFPREVSPYKRICFERGV
jgi:hypothetical protein